MSLQGRDEGYRAGAAPGAGEAQQPCAPRRRSPSLPRSGEAPLGDDWLAAHATSMARMRESVARWRDERMRLVGTRERPSLGAMRRQFEVPAYGEGAVRAVEHALTREECERAQACCICLCPFEPEAGDVVMVKCRHLFHDGCLGRWTAQHDTCPLCRADIRD